MSSITIKGVDELMRKLDKAAAIDTLKPPMQRSVMLLQRRMAQYPTQRVGSSYIRTGTLGRRWTTKITRSRAGLTGKVGNNTLYAPFVQSNRFQADVHRGRWQTDEAVVNRSLKRIESDFTRAIDKALK
jgi:hypothetical protein